MSRSFLEAKRSPREFVHKDTTSGKKHKGWFYAGLGKFSFLREHKDGCDPIMIEVPTRMIKRAIQEMDEEQEGNIVLNWRKK